PHNLTEICNGIVALIDDPSITINELMKIVPGPDFPTGGNLCGQHGVREAYATGRGTVMLRGKYHIEETKNGRKLIVFDEIPYNLLRITITERAAEAIKDGKLPEVSEYNDESDRKNPIRLVFEVRRDGNEELALNQIFEFTPLQSNFTIISIALVTRQPRTM